MFNFGWGVSFRKQMAENQHGLSFSRRNILFFRFIAFDCSEPFSMCRGPILFCFDVPNKAVISSKE